MTVKLISIFMEKNSLENNKIAGFHRYRTVQVQTINDFGVSEWSEVHKFLTIPG